MKARKFRCERQKTEVFGKKECGQIIMNTLTSRETENLGHSATPKTVNFQIHRAKAVCSCSIRVSQCARRSLESFSLGKGYYMPGSEVQDQYFEQDA